MLHFPAAAATKAKIRIRGLQPLRVPAEAGGRFGELQESAEDHMVPIIMVPRRMVTGCLSFWRRRHGVYGATMFVVSY